MSTNAPTRRAVSEEVVSTRTVATSASATRPSSVRFTLSIVVNLYSPQVIPTTAALQQTVRQTLTESQNDKMLRLMKFNKVFPDCIAKCSC